MTNWGKGMRPLLAAANRTIPAEELEPEEERRPADPPPFLLDPEVGAINKVILALNPLDEAARDRVMEYVRSRFKAYQFTEE
jgi:hypothetical protein